MINAGIGAATGDWSGVGAGIGGMVGSFIGAGAADVVSGFLGEAAFSFGGGFLIGATEFGIAGFGAGFGGALGGGANLGDAAAVGLMSGGIGAVAGGIIEGSYLAGWQDTLHGRSRKQVYESAMRRLRSRSLTKNDFTTITVGSRPVGRTPANNLDLRHRFIRGGPGGGFEMGPDDATRFIEINGENSFPQTEHYLNNQAELVMQTSVNVSESGLLVAERLYTAAWTDVTYNPVHHNSNYAVNTVVYGSGGNVPENLGRTPQFGY